MTISPSPDHDQPDVQLDTQPMAEAVPYLATSSTGVVSLHHAGDQTDPVHEPSCWPSMTFHDLPIANYNRFFGGFLKWGYPKMDGLSWTIQWTWIIYKFIMVQKSPYFAIGFPLDQVQLRYFGWGTPQFPVAQVADEHIVLDQRKSRQVEVGNAEKQHVPSIFHEFFLSVGGINHISFIY